MNIQISIQVHIVTTQVIANLKCTTKLQNRHDILHISRLHGIRFTQTAFNSSALSNTKSKVHISVTNLSCCQSCDRAAFPLSHVPWMLLNICMATQSKRCIYKQSLMQSLILCLFPSADIGVQIQPMRTALIEWCS